MSDKRARWDNSVWDHWSPISQRWPRRNVTKPGKRCVKVCWCCASFSIWPPAEVIYTRNMFQLLSWWSESIRIEGQGAAKTLLPDESFWRFCQKLAFISHPSWCEGQQTNLMHHVLTIWLNFNCFVSARNPLCLTAINYQDSGIECCPVSCSLGPGVKGN